MSDPLFAVSPVDGRYWREVGEEVGRYFSEYALIKYRVRIEVEYLKLVASKLNLPTDGLDDIYEGFGLPEARRVKEIEQQTHHDVESVVRYVKERLREAGMDRLAPLVHIGLTSEDMNNIAYSLALSEFNKNTLIPSLGSLIITLAELAREHRDTVMLARTHGVPAIPTTLGKELSYHAYRLLRAYEKLKEAKFPAKISGAVGTYASLREVFGEEYMEVLMKFIENLSLEPWPVTKQTLPHDNISEYLHELSRLSMVMLDLARDLWLMNLLGYVRRRRMGVGSSTMPHKVNPVEVENAEGNLELAATLLDFMARKLMITRLQRDLSDSTVRRNYGVALAHLLQAIKGLERFLKRIEFDKGAMAEDVEKNPEWVSEPAQIRTRLAGLDILEEIRSIEERGEEYLNNLRKVVKEAGEDPDKIIPKKPDEYLGKSGELVELVYRLCIDRVNYRQV